MASARLRKKFRGGHSCTPEQPGAPRSPHGPPSSTPNSWTSPRAIKGAKRFGQHALFISFEAAVCSERGIVEAADRSFRDLLRSPMPIPTSGMSGTCSAPAGRKQASRSSTNGSGQHDRHIFWPSAACLAADGRSSRGMARRRRQADRCVRHRGPASPARQVAGSSRTSSSSPGQPLAQSVRGGTQTDGNLFHRIEPEIVALREALRQAVAIHAERLPPVRSGSPARSRTVRRTIRSAEPGRLSSRRRHPHQPCSSQGWLSSALYIALPRWIEPDDSRGGLSSGSPMRRSGPDCRPARLMQPRPGRLVLFPSWMWHGTRPFAEGARLTVAFDVMPARRDGG